MSAPAAPGGPVDPEAEYFQAVQEYFVERRGDPLFLSSADWLLVRRWRRAGIPLRIVLRGIRDAFEGHAHSWARTRKVGRLRYCEREVAAARERWRRALRTGQDGALSEGQHLRALAQALREPRDVPAVLAETCVRLAEELEQETENDDTPAGLEERLQERERRLLKAVRRVLEAAALAALDAATERELAPYRARMPSAVVQQVRDEAVARSLLGRFGLPRLSLFHTG